MRKRFGLLFAMFSIFILIVVYYFCALLDGSWPFNGIDKGELGTFGDSWGMLTSIFSVLAFMGVGFSLILQTEAFKHSEDFTRKQSFESNLFQMLSLLQEMISSINVRKTDDEDEFERVRVRAGRSSFKVIYEVTSDGIGGALRSSRYDSLSDMYIHLNSLYSGYSEHININLGHYFRFLYNIFKFIYNSDVNQEDKLAYARIVRAQISNYELLLLFYNLMVSDGVKFEKYICEYQIFDNLPIDNLIDKHHSLLLDPKSFGSNPYYKPEVFLKEFNKKII